MFLICREKAGASWDLSLILAFLVLRCAFHTNCGVKWVISEMVIIGKLKGKRLEVPLIMTSPRVFVPKDTFARIANWDGKVL